MLPISLRMKNFCSHKDSFIDFTIFQSALLIGNNEGNYDVSNGTGKSNVFEAVPWALFGKSRSEFADDVVLWGEESCSVEFVFLHDKIEYKIIRIRNRIISQTSISFYKKVNDNWVDISGSTSSLTNKEIVSVISFDYNTFINSSYFRQNDVSEFAKANAARKKEILKSIIDLSKWDEYESEVKSKIKNLKSECKILESLTEGSDELQKELGEISTKLDDNLQSLTNTKAQLISKEATLNSAQSKYFDLKATLDTDKWDSLVEEISSTKSKINNLKLKLSTFNLDINNSNKDIELLKEDIENKKSTLNDIQVISDIDDQIQAKNDELIKNKSAVSSSEEFLEHLEESKHLLSSGDCPVCTQSISEEFSQKLFDERLDKKDQLTNKIIYSKNKISEIVGQLKKLEQIKKNNQKEKNIRSEIKNLNVELKIKSENLERLITDKDVFSSELATLIDKLPVLESSLNALKNNDFKELQEMINVLKKEHSELSLESSRLNRLVGGLSEKKSSMEERIASMNETKKNLDFKKQELSVLDALLKYFGKNGIQIVLLETVISDLETEANKILSHICQESFEIMLETQRKGSDGESIVETLDLVVRKDGMVQSFSSLSGGEQFRIAIALRIALSEISCRHGGSQLDFILLDEVNSPLDRSGTESLFVNVIKALEERYKVLVVTHNDLLKEKFDHIINVTKVNGESTTTFTSR